MRQRYSPWIATRFVLLVLAAVVLLAPAQTIAQTTDQTRADDQARLEAFLEVTGFGVALDSIALAAADAPILLGMQASDFGSDWKRLSEDVFDEATMRGMAKSILGAALSDDLLTHAADFYASDLGQRLVVAENASHLADDDAKQAEGAAIVAKGVSEADPRIETLRKLNGAVDGANTAVRAVQEIQVRFLMAASNAGILERQLDEAALRAALKENESQLRLNLQTAALAGSAYTYQDFSLDDLKAYLTALEHPDMQQVYELMNAVQYEIMANRFEALAARMAELHPGQDL